MKRYSLHKNWEYLESTLQNPLLVNMLKGWKKTDLPHDYSMEKERNPNDVNGLDEGFFQGAGLYYKKSFSVNPLAIGKRFCLEFEGIAGTTEVWVNKKLVAKHRNPYTAFFADVTQHIVAGTNEITLHTDNRTKPDSRWYVGCGVYRPVWLHVGNTLSIMPSGLKAHTVSLENNRAVLAISTEIYGCAQEFNYELLNSEGEIVASIKGDATVQMHLESITPWSTENPYLYTLRATAIDKNGESDVAEISIGIRTIKVNPQQGLLINDTPLKLKGGCIHHDLGILGAAEHYSAEYRRIKTLKESGFNAVRLAHNPFGTAILDVCDKLGILCVYEAFDEWVLGRTSFGLHTTFELCWQQDLEDMINKNYNHPCIIMWGTGNEVEERDGSADGFAWAKKLADKVRSLDLSRPVTASACALFAEYGNCPANGTTGNQALNMAYDAFAEGNDIWGPATAEYFAPVDVAGYNYKVARYAYDAQKYPNRVIYGSESYPRAALLSWQGARDNNNVLGDFVWTAWDYIGEVGVGRFEVSTAQHPSQPQWPWLSAYCADIDLIGNKRPQSYYRDVIWGVAKKPRIFCLPPHLTGKSLARLSWAWLPVERNYTFENSEGEPIEVHVYANADEVELFANGTSFGKMPCTEEQEYIAVFNIPYTAGKLEAVAYKNNIEIGRDTLCTTKNAVKLELTAETEATANDGMDLCFINIQAVDENGLAVFGCDDTVTVELQGEGKIIALGSANPKPDSLLPFANNSCPLYNGQALLVVRSAQGAQSANVKASFKSCETQLAINFKDKAIEEDTLITEIAPSALDLPLGELLKNESVNQILQSNIGQLLQSPMLSQMQHMPLKKLLGMGGTAISAEFEKLVNDAMGM